jgi:hypothetical protein
MLLQLSATSGSMRIRDSIFLARKKIELEADSEEFRLGAEPQATIEDPNSLELDHNVFRK